MRDENGFKCHTQSESHVRQMLLIGEDSRKHISDYSSQFQRDFLQLLKTSHGEKKININHFCGLFTIQHFLEDLLMIYLDQEYISNKQHIHMNATRWPSLTEFAKWLGREGICRVEEGDKGLEVAWIDNSPEALRRQDAIRKKERQDKGDEEREQKLIREQIKKAKRDAEEKGDIGLVVEPRLLQREEGEKIKLSFAAKAVIHKQPSPPPSSAPESKEISDDGVATKVEENTSAPPPTVIPDLPPEKIALKMSSTNKPKNVFTTASKKNALGMAKTAPKDAPKKPMSEAERIMKEEIERKRIRELSVHSGLNAKRQRVV